MAICDSCGNNYEPSLTITTKDHTYHFDCFECAINRLAPACSHCRTKIVGHGLQSGDTFYCCAHCARSAGVEGLRDSA